MALIKPGAPRIESMFFDFLAHELYTFLINMVFIIKGPALVPHCKLCVRFDFDLIGQDTGG
ncbi:hypothetical protein CCACVL1_16849 [Corchorus capsularis]|uniref:Uncharacterized protein n=1 Tax=Corchorus capsularis TaxID=210143 RepID=A0A1R3HVB0_COCAP|nr:hypothetical protein CCACVL1_16849 [Corchorus capsularis]